MPSRFWILPVFVLGLLAGRALSGHAAESQAPTEKSGEASMMADAQQAKQQKGDHRVPASAATARALSPEETLAKLPLTLLACETNRRTRSVLEKARARYSNFTIWRTPANDPAIARWVDYVKHTCNKIGSQRDVYFGRGTYTLGEKRVPFMVRFNFNESTEIDKDENGQEVRRTSFEPGSLELMLDAKEEHPIAVWGFAGEFFLLDANPAAFVSLTGDTSSELGAAAFLELPLASEHTSLTITNADAEQIASGSIDWDHFPLMSDPPIDWQNFGQASPTPPQ